MSYAYSGVFTKAFTIMIKRFAITRGVTPSLPRLPNLWVRLDLS